MLNKPNIPADKIFIVEEDITSYADALAAIEAGEKIVFCKYFNVYLPYRYKDTEGTLWFGESYDTFSSNLKVTASKYLVACLDTDGYWGGAAINRSPFLDTTSEASLTPNSSEDFYHKITLHKVSKTGNYNDLLNKPTIPTDVVKYTAQTLTDAQKSQARTNIGATALEDIRQFKVLNLGDFWPSGTGTQTLGTKSEAAAALNITEAQVDSLLNGEYDYIEMSATALGAYKSTSVPPYMSEYVYVGYNEHNVAMPFRIRFQNFNNTGVYSYTYEPIGIKDITVGGESAIGTSGIAIIPAIPTTYAGSPTAGGFANKTVAIPFGNVDSTSTATEITATVDNFPETLTDGVCAYIRNNVISSASG